MKLVLPDALHARPANLFVRLASQFAARIEVRKEAKRADAKSILQLLTLGAAKGIEIELVAEGPDAGEALAALSNLIARNFDADLVPETGSGAVEGIVVGRALVLGESAPAVDAGEDVLRAAFASVTEELALIVRTLPKSEADLFAPEIEIVREMQDPVLSRVARGENAEDAIRAEAPPASDLVIDARERLLDALAGGSRLARTLADAPAGDLVLVAPVLTPSVVTALPERVVGIIAIEEAQSRASHAAILARGRGIPLMYVPEPVIAGVPDGEIVVLDTTVTPSRLWVSPSEAKIEEARARWKARRDEAPEIEREAAAQLGIAVRVNVSSVHDVIPALADGVGLVRTELVFTGVRRAPSEDDQVALLWTIAEKAAGRPVVVRLFDAGGDKPMSWLPGDARGIALLRQHPKILAAQMRAIARVRERGADVRVLVPLVRDVEDMRAVRALADRLSVGAMVETKEAVDRIDELAGVSDFVSIGTNDLAADAGESNVLALVARIVERAHACSRQVTVCGEIAGDPAVAMQLVGLSVDALSVAPPRLVPLRAALARAIVPAR